MLITADKNLYLTAHAYSKNVHLLDQPTKPPTELQKQKKAQRTKEDKKATGRAIVLGVAIILLFVFGFSNFNGASLKSSTPVPRLQVSSDYALLYNKLKASDNTLVTEIRKGELQGGRIMFELYITSLSKTKTIEVQSIKLYHSDGREMPTNEKNTTAKIGPLNEVSGVLHWYDGSGGNYGLRVSYHDGTSSRTLDLPLSINADKKQITPP